MVNRSAWHGGPCLLALIAACALAACGGSRPAKINLGLSQSVVQVNKIPITVLWRPDLPVKAEASGAIPPTEAVVYATQAISMATGCQAERDNQPFGRSTFIGQDGILRITLPLNCAAPLETKPPEGSALASTVPPPANPTPIQAADPALAAAVETAVKNVLNERRPAPVATAAPSAVTPVEVTSRDDLVTPAQASTVTPT